MHTLLKDESGFVVSAELVLVLTIGVLAMVVGLASLRDSLTSEVIDLSNAFGAIDQTFNYNTIQKGKAATVTTHGIAFGAGYNDNADDCDCDCAKVAFTDVTGKKDQSTGDANDGN